MIQIEIDEGSGFCFGVTTAIKKAEEELAKGEKLYCLGDIVHNGRECDRLREMGLITINHEEMEQLHDAKVLLRAHGEPPETYELARKNNIEIIDATCPVVLKLQKRIKEQYETSPNLPKGEESQIVIFGKKDTQRCLVLWGRHRAMPLSSRVATRLQNSILHATSTSIRRPPSRSTSLTASSITSRRTYRLMPPLRASTPSVVR